MLNNLALHLRLLSLSLLSIIVVCCLFFTSTLPVLANTVRISDPVEVLNVQQVTNEGAKLAYPLDVYTTGTFSGTATDFVQRTISAHLTSKQLIVIAIDVVHRYLAIVGGSQVPLSNAQYTSAGQAFKNAAAGNHFTLATRAAIQSLEMSLKQSSKTSTGSSNGGAFLILLGVVVVLVILGSIYRFGKRLFGWGGPPKMQPPDRSQQIRYGDGRDNLGHGAMGDF